MKQNLILCGFMGCGKTTVGRRLAAISGRKFVDMDAFIQEEQSMTILEIFSQLGEPAFRKMETDAARILPKGRILSLPAAAAQFLIRKTHTCSNKEDSSSY